MNILVTTGIFRPELGGPATFASEFSRRLTTIGHSVTVITYSDMPQYAFDGEYTFKLIRVQRSQNKFLNYLRYFLVVMKYARKADFIFSLDWFSAGVPVWLVSIFLSKKYIVRVGGGYIWEKYLAEGNRPVTLRQFYEQGLYKKYKLMSFLIQRVFHGASMVVFNSNEQRELYNRFYNLGQEKTATIFNATPEHKFGSLVQTYKQETFSRDKEIVFAGRFIKMKNVEALIHAFLKLTDHTFKLLLIGNGPEELNLKNLVHSLNLDSRIQFLAPLSQADLYRRIANCYLVVLPSWTDVSPHQAYECLSLNIPILLSRENYLALDKTKLFMIDPTSVDDIAAALNKLLDPHEYQLFVDSLKALDYRHSWDDSVREYLHIFNQVRKKAQ